MWQPVHNYYKTDGSNRIKWGSNGTYSSTTWLKLLVLMRWGQKKTASELPYCVHWAWYRDCVPFLRPSALLRRVSFNICHAAWICSSPSLCAGRTCQQNTVLVISRSCWRGSVQSPPRLLCFPFGCVGWTVFCSRDGHVFSSRRRERRSGFRYWSMSVLRLLETRVSSVENPELSNLF